MTHYSNEKFENDFAIVLYEDKTPIICFQMDYDETLKLGGSSEREDYTLIEIVDFLQDTLGFERREPNRKIEQVLKQVNSQGYFYKNEYVGGYYTDEKGRQRPSCRHDYDLTLVKVDTKEEILKFNCYNSSVCETFIAEVIKSNVMPYEDTEEYKLIKLQEQEEKERLEQERLQLEQEKAKAIEEGRMKEYYENMLMEQEKRHKEELIAMKMKEIEELQK